MDRTRSIVFKATIQVMNTSLHLLYTANLRGKLELLPRLHTFLHQLKALPLDEGEDVMICAVQPVARPTLLLDLGNACSAEVWHCAATGGRSVLIGLDAMGYQAANVSGILAPDSRTRLRDNLMSMALVDEENPHEDRDILMTAGEKTDTAQNRSDLHIVLTPDSTTRLEGKKLRLASVEAGQVGVVFISGLDYQPRIEAQNVLDMPASTPPDPTLAGTADFILSEARLYQRRKEPEG